MEREKIILGCGNFGGVGSEPQLKDFGEDEIQACAILNEARELGIFQFDTANTYGGGASEEILGNWISKQTSAYRRKVQISTKVGNPHGATLGRSPLSSAEISFHLDKSLTRLHVEQVSAYYIHEPDPKTPIDETLQALDKALSAGKIFSIGLSNVNLGYLRDFLGTCGEALRRKVRYVQNEFHFLHQEDRAELIPFLSENDIGYVAFSPLAGGLLTGKYSLSSEPCSGSRLALRREPYSRYLNEGTFSTISAFIAEAHSKNLSPAEAAVRFVLETQGIIATIIGPRRKEHFENLGLKRS